MSTIAIRASQAVIDQSRAADLSSPELNGSIGALIDALLFIGYAVSKDYGEISNWGFDGSTLSLEFPDGATLRYTGVVLSNPESLSGTGTARGVEFFKDGLVTVAQSGSINFDYAVSRSPAGDFLTLSDHAGGSTITAYRLSTALPPEEEDPILGDFAVLLNGAVHTSSSGEIAGKLTKITITAEKHILHYTVEGNFDIAGNELEIAQQLSHSTVTGTLTGLRQEYRDGSFARISDIAMSITSSQVLDESLFADGERFPHADDFNIDLPGRIYDPWSIASGAGDDRITLNGGGGLLNVNAGSGNDLITVIGDSHLIDGGSGIDLLALQLPRAAYSIEQTATGYKVTDPAGAINALSHVERIHFADTAYALDIAGNGGQAYRLYQAAFHRTPDLGGLGFWIGVLDKGTALNTVAAGFVGSAEFISVYGASPPNETLVARFYENILGRAAEPAGLEFWSNVLNSHQATVPEVLAAISESPENQIGLIGTIGSGFPYIPYG